MRILICVHSLSNGGAEHVAALWANGFAERGHDVIVVLSDQIEQYDFSLSSKVRVENIFIEGNPIIRYIKKLLLLRKLLCRIKPDVALAVLNPWSEWLLFTTIGLKTIVINTEHDSFERPASAPMRHSTYFRKFWLNKLFSAVTVLTEADKKIIGKRIRNVFVMPNPLAFESCYYPNEKKQIILAAGRLDQWHVKGFDLLINAWGKVAKKYPNWELQIAGRGDDHDIQRIMEWIRLNDVEEHTKILGFCSRFNDICRQASIFVLSSRYEGFGMVLIESMSQGCAPVAADYMGRASEIITKPEEGFICAVESENELAHCIEHLIENDALRQMIQKNAYYRSSYFSINNTIDRWYSIFKRLGLDKKLNKYID